MIDDLLVLYIIALSILFVLSCRSCVALKLRVDYLERELAKDFAERGKTF